MLYRTIVREHIPKRCGNFEVPIENKKTFDSTSERIYGKKIVTPVMDTESNLIGSGYNPADALPRQGRKTLNSDQEVSIFQNERLTKRKMMPFFNLINLTHLFFSIN